MPFDFVRKEVTSMATKSFLKDVKISDRKLASTFVSALEKANNDRYQSKTVSRPVQEPKGYQIKEFFNKK